VALPIGPSEWIILDTTIVRGLIANESDALDLEPLSAVRGKHPIALADAVPAEIIDWLLDVRASPRFGLTSLQRRHPRTRRLTRCC
jgi:hypothetical protein